MSDGSGSFFPNPMALRLARKLRHRTEASGQGCWRNLLPRQVPQSSVIDFAKLAAISLKDQLILL
jgi:hypothetical protein